MINEIAGAHGKTPAQAMLRWHLQQGRQASRSRSRRRGAAGLLAAKHLLFQADAEDLERIERKIDHIHERVGAGPAGPEQGDDAAIDPEPRSA